MGDFNTNLLAPNSPRSRKLLHVLDASSLHVLPLHATHRSTTGDDSWLDLILTSNLSLVSSHGQYTAPGFSHHDLIFLSYILKPPKPKPKILHRRCFARMDVERLLKDALDIDWTPLMGSDAVDDKIMIFNNMVNSLYDRHAPVKRVRVKRPPAPWMTELIRIAMRRRDRAFRKFKKDRTEENWAQFKTARNRCNMMIRNAKRRHILNNIASSSSADIWKFLGTLGVGKSRHLDLPNTISLDALNSHFCTYSTLDYLTKQDTLNHIAGLTRPDIEPFDFLPVNDEEVKKIILSIKSKAVGCDNISRQMIIPILVPILPVITHIINFSLYSGVFPSLWRKAYVRPLPKISSPTLPSHFRPISILPFLSKVLEACAHKQFSRFIYGNTLMSPLQSGFRPGHSTSSALLKVTGDIRIAMEDASLTVLVLVDFSNAFNTVSHDILLSILSHLMVSSKALDWFSSYLQDRQQSVRGEDSSSTWCTLNAGVPQGGILSPLLFSIFINFLTPELQCSYHLYADDLQLYRHTKADELAATLQKINKDLEVVKNWADRFGVTVNPGKCQAIIIGSSRNLGKVDASDLPPLVFNGLTIPYSCTVKNLGLIFDSSLNWQAQVAAVSQKVTNTLRFLYRLKNLLPFDVKAMLMRTLIFPIIDYGDVCYYDLNADLLNKLDRLLNNCIRFVFNLRKYDHVSAYRSQLKWLPIRQRRVMRALTTLFSILYTPSSPSYLTSHFQYVCSQHNKNLRSSNNRLLHCPSHRSDIIHSSFFIKSILLWNELPLEVRMVNSRHTFKLKLRDYIHRKLAESSQ